MEMVEGITEQTGKVEEKGSEEVSDAVRQPGTSSVDDTKAEKGLRKDASAAVAKPEEKTETETETEGKIDLS